MLTRHGERAAIDVTPRLLATSSDVVREAALAGTGIAMLPTSLVDDALARGVLRIVLPGWDIGTLRIYALHPNRRTHPARLRVFLVRTRRALRPRPRRRRLRARALKDGCSGTTRAGGAPLSERRLPQGGRQIAPGVVIHMRPASRAAGTVEPLERMAVSLQTTPGVGCPVWVAMESSP